MSTTLDKTTVIAVPQAVMPLNDRSQNVPPQQIAGTNFKLKSCLKPTSVSRAQVPEGAWMHLSPLGGSLLADCADSIQISGARFVCGRKASACLQLESGLVSGTHFRIKRTGSHAVLKDESTNGVFHNGKLLGKGNTVNLAHGDCISLPKQLADFAVNLHHSNEATMSGGANGVGKSHAHKNWQDEAVSAMLARAKAKRLAKAKAKHTAKAKVKTRAREKGGDNRDHCKRSKPGVRGPQVDSMYADALQEAQEQQKRDEEELERANRQKSIAQQTPRSLARVCTSLTAAEQLHEREMLSECLPAADLVGTRILVDTIGVVTVLDWQQGTFLGFGPSQHLLQIDYDCSQIARQKVESGKQPSKSGAKVHIERKEEVWRVLNRHGNGGLRFVILPEQLCSTADRMALSSQTVCAATTAMELGAQIGDHLGFNFENFASRIEDAEESEDEAEGEDLSVVPIVSENNCPETTSTAEDDDTDSTISSFFTTIGQVIFGADDNEQASVDSQPANVAASTREEPSRTHSDAAIEDMAVELAHEVERLEHHCANQRVMIHMLTQQVQRARGFALSGIVRQRQRMQRHIAFAKWSRVTCSRKFERKLKQLTGKANAVAKVLDAHAESNVGSGGHGEIVVSSDATARTSPLSDLVASMF